MVLNSVIFLEIRENVEAFSNYLTKVVKGFDFETWHALKSWQLTFSLNYLKTEVEILAYVLGFPEFLKTV